MLLACGADVSAMEMGSHRTPMMIAAAEGNAELMNVIKEKDPGYHLVKDREVNITIHIYYYKERRKKKCHNSKLPISDLGRQLYTIHP